MRAAALLLAAAAGGAEASNSSAAATWCYAPPLSAGAAPPAGSDFRGSYRDLSLYHLATPAAPRPPSCNSIVVQRRQDEGLWVLELKTPADARAAERKIKRDGITVARALNASLIVLGGENLPDRTGYDACGAEPGVAVVPVPEYTVRLPRRVPAAELARLRQSVTVARKNDPVQKAVDEVSEASAKATVSALQEHNTRNSYSEGVRDAQKWIEERFAGYGFSVSRFEWRADMSPVVVAELKGSAHPEKVIVAGAHYDSRSTDNTSPTQRAPGADDNASGTSAMLEIARVIHALGLKLEYTLRLCAFSGEEQGLLGSRALALSRAQTRARWEPLRELPSASPCESGSGPTRGSTWWPCSTPTCWAGRSPTSPSPWASRTATSARRPPRWCAGWWRSTSQGCRPPTPPAVAATTSPSTRTVSRRWASSRTPSRRAPTPTTTRPRTF
eukprot:TRINITY_DN2669_c0_g1_i1.p1 TRINITY_DN2669_c0_g1~~TRINITY_DN2669_c0_g1_i1.p1  ORF type:complete len:470 (+),score=79.77 TRINITY_DN2669_c0_g1_i1:76-1410(+)